MQYTCNYRNSPCPGCLTNCLQERRGYPCKIRQCLPANGLGSMAQTVPSGRISVKEVRLHITLSLHLIGTAGGKELSPFAFKQTSWETFRKTLPAAAAFQILYIERLQSLPPSIHRLLHNIRYSVLQSDLMDFVLPFTSPVQALPSLTVLYVVVGQGCFLLFVH
jgi:hypothetical protein